MSILPRGFGSGASVDPTSFHPLFRFLDDFDNYNQASSTTKDPHHSHSLRTFSPKFDVKETADNYELHGELPGIEQKDVEIEFTDSQTLIIHGLTERSYTRSTPPAGKYISDNKNNGAITEQGESGYQPTVEDEDEAKKPENGGNSNNASIATRSKEEAQQQHQTKLWVSERSIGEFSRSFNFPTNVDSDAVTASLKNGILSIVVPKTKKSGGRKIQVTS